MKCPDCGSTELLMASGDIVTSDKTDFCCLDCGLVFFAFNGKVYTERDLAQFEEEQRQRSESEGLIKNKPAFSI